MSNNESAAKLYSSIGEISDGYHTFNDLYYQRAVLFATIVNQNLEISWKSWKHSDGSPCDKDEPSDWFIVGIDTPEGQYTYHYNKKYWDLFKCKELDTGKEWDGHTEKDITRLLSLDKSESYLVAIHLLDNTGELLDVLFKCSNCDCIEKVSSNYCPECGSKIIRIISKEEALIKLGKEYKDIYAIEDDEIVTSSHTISVDKFENLPEEGNVYATYLVSGSDPNVFFDIYKWSDNKYIKTGIIHKPVI